MGGQALSQAGDKPTVRLAFCDFWHPETREAVREKNPIYKLLCRHYHVQLVDDPDFLVYSCFGLRHLKYRCTRIFFTGENLRPDFGVCDYAFSFDFPVDERNYRLPLYRLWDDYEATMSRRRTVPDPAGQKFCNFLYSNRKARERIEFFHLLEQYRRIDSGGRVLNNMEERIDDKMAFLSEYKFTIAFENSSHPGYTTEKLYEALVANTIPIYWGNPLAGRDFNPQTFINCHDHESFDAVVDRIREVDQDDALYRAYLEAPIYADGRENEFVREENIMARFAEIFGGGNHSRAAGKMDPLRYRLHPGNLYWAARRAWWWARAR